MQNFRSCFVNFDELIASKCYKKVLTHVGDGSAIVSHQALDADARFDDAQTKIGEFDEIFVVRLVAVGEQNVFHFDIPVNNVFEHVLSRAEGQLARATTILV